LKNSNPQLKVCIYKIFSLFKTLIIHKYNYKYLFIPLKEIPIEFMETYSNLNNRYKEELFAVRDFCFHEYVEPVIVEEEAIAQIQFWIRKNKNCSVEEFKEANLYPRKYPIRHQRFINWYNFMKSEVEGLGRGQLLVNYRILKVQNATQNLSELEGNAGKPMEIRDLTRRLEWNKLRVGNSFQN
jgi:hypothetical protein